MHPQRSRRQRLRQYALAQLSRPAFRPPRTTHFGNAVLEWHPLVPLPLGAGDDLARRRVLNVDPLDRRVRCGVLVPQPGFGLRDGGLAVSWGVAEDGEEDGCGGHVGSVLG